MDNYKIGNFMQSLRKRMGLTQQQIADVFKINNKTVSKWECGETLPDIPLLISVAEFYNVTMDEILRGEKNTSSNLTDEEIIEKNRQVREENIINHRLCQFKLFYSISISFMSTGFGIWFMINLVNLPGQKRFLASSFVLTLCLFFSFLMNLLGNHLLSKIPFKLKKDRELHFTHLKFQHQYWYGFIYGGIILNYLFFLSDNEINWLMLYSVSCWIILFVFALKLFLKLNQFFFNKKYSMHIKNTVFKVEKYKLIYWIMLGIFFIIILATTFYQYCYWEKINESYFCIKGNLFYCVSNHHKSSFFYLSISAILSSILMTIFYRKFQNVNLILLNFGIILMLLWFNQCQDTDKIKNFLIIPYNSFDRNYLALNVLIFSFTLIIILRIGYKFLWKFLQR